MGEFEDPRRKHGMMSANNGRSGDVRDTEFWKNHDVYDKLERPRGHKVFGKRGVLDYKGVKIMFNNKIYRKESMDDELKLCSTIKYIGKRAWTICSFVLDSPSTVLMPVIPLIETFNAIREDFSDEKKVYSDATRPRFCSQKTSEKVSK